MPTFDRRCEACDWQVIDVVEPSVFPAPPCPNCGTPTVRAWLTKAAAVVDDSFSHIQINGTATPIHFTSKQDRRRWLKATGQGERVQHVGLDGSDKSKHTSRWVAMDAYTLNNAKILLERAAQQPTRNEPKETPLKSKLTMGDLNSPEFTRWKNGR